MSDEPECAQCGLCCTHIYLKFPCYTDIEKEFFTVRGYKVENNQFTIRVDEPCPHLQEDMKCDLHETGKPSACRSYPHNRLREYVPESCTLRDKAITKPQPIVGEDGKVGIDMSKPGPGVTVNKGAFKRDHRLKYELNRLKHKLKKK